MSGRLWQKVCRQKLNSIGSHEIQSVLMYQQQLFKQQYSNFGKIEGTSFGNKE